MMLFLLVGWEAIGTTRRVLPWSLLRGQYDSRQLLSHLLQTPGSGRVLGVTGVDLFAPVLTFVLGEAHLDGRCALVSTHRLREEHYGYAPNSRLLQQRLEKEALHELGHSHGLVHCPSWNCVMHASATVEDVDLKATRFCRSCLGATRRRGSL